MAMGDESGMSEAVSDRSADWFEEPFLRGMNAIIEGAPDGIIIADYESRELVTMNNTAVRLLQRARHDLVGEHHHVLHPPEERLAAEQLFERVANREGGPVSQYDDGSQVHVLTGSNDRIPVEINVSVFVLDGDQYVQGHFRDISEHVERRRLHEVFREAVEQAGHSIFITDSNGYIEYANPAFETVSGYRCDEVVGETPAILNSGVQDDAFYEEMWATILRGDVWRGELVNEAKDGSHYHIEQTIAPIFDEQGSIRHFVAVNHDITDRKRQQRQLKRERERLHEFATTVAHDLRTPLSVARARVSHACDAGELDGLEPADGALEQMERLIDSLLTLSKQGETVDEPAPTPLTEAIEQAWAVTPTLSATLDIAIADDRTIEADATRLEQLLVNLFDNAVAHAGPEVRLEVLPLDGCNGFAVADDGPGVVPADRARIFDSGVSLDDRTGYGLAIVQQIVGAHGWEIAVGESDAGGLRIAFHVPPCDCDTGTDVVV